MAAFVLNSTSELSYCMIIKSFIKQIMLHQVDQQIKFKFICVQFLILADERQSKEEENMILNKKRKRYVKRDRDTESDELYASLDEVESNEKESGYQNLENDLVPDEQQNDALIPEANIHLVKGAESEANDEENNVKLKQ